MARERKVHLNWWIIVPVVLVALIVLASLLRLALVKGDSEEGPAPQPTSSTAPDPEPTFTRDYPATGDGSESVEEYEPASPLVDEFDCQNSMTDEQYASFMNRLYEFEVISHMQPSDERLTLMRPYVTDAFMYTQVGFFKSPPVENLTVEVSRDSAMSCAMDTDNVVLARITPTITVVQQNADGTKTIVHETMTLPVVHFTRWVLWNDAWYVDQEEK